MLSAPPPLPVPSPYRVAIVEDHPMVREGLTFLLGGAADFVLCGEAATPAEALALARTARPDVVCLDLVLGGEDGFGLIRELLGIDPQIRILVLTARAEGEFAERCIEAGALGFAMKSEPNEVLLEALRCVARGRVHLSGRVAMAVLGEVPRTTGAARSVPGLSERESQVFQLLGLGWTSRQVGERLGIGLKTVETHRENIKNKLGLDHNTALQREAMLWLRRNG